jgi:hypothetical protein
VSVGGSDVIELDAGRTGWKDDQCSAGWWRCSGLVQSTECNGRSAEGEQNQRASLKAPRSCHEGARRNAKF